MSRVYRDVELTGAWEVVQDAVDRAEIPGAVALVRRHGRTVLHEAAGCAALEPERRAMTVDTVFDLASLTKPLATTPLVLQCVARQMIALDDPISRYLPTMGRFGGGEITIRHLLTHTSGLPAWSPLYVWARTREDVLQTIARTEPAYAPGTRVIYSCLGYIVLGILIETLTGWPLDEAASRWLFEPLGLDDIGFGPVQQDRCAWTERGNVHERRNVAAAGLEFGGWRTDFTAGTVHDGNAWYAMNGISGNAGSFGTAHAVGTLGQLWLNGGRIGDVGLLPEGLVVEATTVQTPGLDEARGLGWQINRPGRAETGVETLAPRSAGAQLSMCAFGHTGFTGTSIWIDPEFDVVAVLLTNRIHPVVGDSAPITSLRGRFHDAVVLALQSVDPAGPLGTHE